MIKLALLSPSRLACGDERDEQGTDERQDRADVVGLRRASHCHNGYECRPTQHTTIVTAILDDHESTLGPGADDARLL